MKSIAKMDPRPIVIVDLSQTHRLDTAVVRYLERQGREMASQLWPAPMILAGVVRYSGVHSDLERGGMICNWADHVSMTSSACESGISYTKSGFPTFDAVRNALQWTRIRNQGMGSHPVACNQ